MIHWTGKEEDFAAQRKNGKDYWRISDSIFLTSHPLQGDDNKLCDISEEVKEMLKKFRFRKANNNSAAIIREYNWMLPPFPTVIQLLLSHFSQSGP